MLLQISTFQKRLKMASRYLHACGNRKPELSVFLWLRKGEKTEFMRLTHSQISNIKESDEFLFTICKFIYLRYSGLRLSGQTWTFKRRDVFQKLPYVRKQKWKGIFRIPSYFSSILEIRIVEIISGHLSRQQSYYRHYSKFYYEYITSNVFITIEIFLEFRCSVIIQVRIRLR